MRDLDAEWEHRRDCDPRRISHAVHTAGCKLLRALD
jgi:hypothetical protein